MGRRPARLTAGLAAPLLLAAGAPLTPAEHRALARLVVCPETLRDDTARDLAVRRFVGAYVQAAPGARPAEALAFRTRTLAAKRCADRDSSLTYTVPED